MFSGIVDHFLLRAIVFPALSPLSVNKVLDKGCFFRDFPPFFFHLRLIKMILFFPHQTEMSGSFSFLLNPAPLILKTLFTDRWQASK